MKEQGDDLRVAERAAQWFGTLKESNAGRAAFFKWLAESPRHVEEFLSILSLAQDIAELTPEQHRRIERLAADVDGRDLQTADVIPLSGATERADRSARELSKEIPSIRPPRSRPLILGIAVAASALVVVAAWWIFTIAGWHSYATATGEQRTIELRDGSIVQLNTQSRLEVRYTKDARTLRLLSGQALFKVQHDSARPFLVHAGNAVIQAVGTQFDIYRHSATTEIAVIEGIVEISSEGMGGADPRPESHSRGNAVQSSTDDLTFGSRDRLGAGEVADLAANGTIVKREPLDLAKIEAWRQRRLVFRQSTLDEIATEFNRYNPQLRIRVVGVAATDQHYSGTFDADAPEALLRALAGDATLIQERTAHEIIIRSRTSRDVSLSDSVTAAGGPR